MKHDVRPAAFTLLLGALAALPQVGTSLAQAPQPPADHPAVTVRGQTYTPRSILARNMGTEADQTTAFPPHKIIGNIYYVGTRTLSSFLVVTPRGQHPHRHDLRAQRPGDREIGRSSSASSSPTSRSCSATTPTATTRRATPWSSR